MGRVGAGGRKRPPCCQRPASVGDPRGHGLSPSGAGSQAQEASDALCPCCIPGVCGPRVSGGDNPLDPLTGAAWEEPVTRAGGWWRDPPGTGRCTLSGRRRTWGGVAAGTPGSAADVLGVRTASHGRHRGTQPSRDGREEVPPTGKKQRPRSSCFVTFTSPSC